MIVQALRPYRIRRFFEVLRHDGAARAFSLAWLHLRILAKGEGRGESHLSGAGPVSRYALGAIWHDLARQRAFHVSQAPSVLRKTRSVAVIGDLNLPQCRKYRVEQMAEFWAGLGVDYAYAHVEDEPRCREILQHASHLVLYRLRRSDRLSMYLYEARRLRLPVLYDIDDPLFSVSAYTQYSNMALLPAETAQHFRDDAPLYLDAMNAADALSFSTPGLLQHAEAFSARPAFLRRNFADRVTLDEGARAARPGGGGFTLGLASGSLGHDADIEVVRDAVATFLHRGEDRRVLLLGHASPAVFPDALRDRIVHRPFLDYVSYLRALAATDCVIVPLTEDPFNRCKSAVRVLDAAAVGVPALVSAVGDLPEVVLDGQSGHVVRDGDWEGVLESMARTSGRAGRMGLEARRDLEARWTARAAEPVADREFARWVLA